MSQTHLFLLFVVLNKLFVLFSIFDINTTVAQTFLSICWM